MKKGYNETKYLGCIVKGKFNKRVVNLNNDDVEVIIYKDDIFNIADNFIKSFKLNGKNFILTQAGKKKMYDIVYDFYKNKYDYLLKKDTLETIHTFAFDYVEKLLYGYIEKSSDITY